MKIKENVDIKKYTTFKIGGKFRYFFIIRSEEDLNKAFLFAKEKKIEIFVLGGGSNLIFPDRILNVLALKMEIKGFEILKETKKNVDIKIGAGEIWDKIVERTVGMNLSGLEFLSLIPGTVGATPVQNVGAYGCEVKDTILSVNVFDISRSKLISFSNVGCKFSYRDSIFKKINNKGKYIIISVVFRLNKNKPKVPDYPGVAKYLEGKGIKNPGLVDIRQAIIQIRRSKLPNPKRIANAGSFFKNPIITKNMFYKIIKTNKKNIDIPHFFIGDNKVKIPAGWLIEQAGFKGKSLGKISVYNKNALVLVNSNGATQKELIKAKDKIIQKVYKDFGIKLEQEPEMI